MDVGVPKEIKKHEYRVGLTPESVREFMAAGHRVFVEKNAGSGIYATDEDYVRSGAIILDTPEEVFEKSGLVIKVKEPQPSEWRRLRPDQILFTYLHLAADAGLTAGLQASGCTAIAYETVTDASGGLPLLAPMSEVAGRLAVDAAAACLKRTSCGRGLLLGGVPGVPPAKVAVIGGGVVGTHAARMFVGMGADVVILDRSISRLRALDELFDGRARTRYSTASAIEEETASADVVVGAVLLPGAKAPKLVRRSHLKAMKPHAVVVDVAIDQGGCFETAKPTTHDDPTYDIDGIIHYCVANMPSVVPVTSSQALNNATLPFGLKLAAQGVEAALQDPCLRAGINIRNGKIVHEAVAMSLGSDAAQESTN